MMQTHSKSLFHICTGIALLASLAGGAMTYTSAQATSFLFVKPTPTGSADCSSWANACTLRTAISLSSAGDEIWVQKGIYKPDPVDRTASFELRSGVAIYGGFNGTETQPSQRDPVVNVAVLSGDLKGDDDGFTNNEENSFHVVRATNADSTTVLDGFRIGHGNANGASLPDNNGGGMLNESSSPTLANIYFFVNSATENGGGMHNDNSSPRLINVTFYSNQARIGGGMSGFDSSNPRLVNVTFTGNAASFHGGGMANARNNPTLINVTFSGNGAEGGGGMFNNSSSPTMINTIIANSPRGGACAGAIVNATSSNNLIDDPSNACGLTNGDNGNIIGADPNLGPPTINNGGPTPTHALLPGSPAIDAGTNANQICPPTDQRGVKRPQGSQCDIGAFELRIFTIQGNAGTAGVILSYINVAVKKVTSKPNGAYSLTIPEGWTGTVTPAHACYTFTPAFRNYSNVTTNQTAQNYAPLFKPASPCAEVVARIKATTRTLVVPNREARNLKLVGVNDGPVLINGTGKNNVRFVASESVILSNGYFAELMGLPKEFLSTRYAFPWYNSRDFDSQIRIANISNVTTTVTISILNQPLTSCMPRNGPYNLPKGASIVVSCRGWSAGPLVVKSSAGNIIASLRVLPETGGASYSEIMGVPANQLSNTYAFPWYDNKNLNTQLRVANVGGGPTTTVRLFMGTKEITSCTSSKPYPFKIAKGASLQVSCGEVNKGPLKVVGSAGISIIASLRILHKTGSTARFSEMMGLPAKQFSTAYTFPWYNNKNLKTQLRIGNIGNAPSQVHLFLGSLEMTTGCTSIPPTPYPFRIPKGTTLVVSCPNLSKGPVRVIGSAGIHLVASLRILPKNAAAGTVFSELMGLPLNRSSTRYIFPWYDNKNFNTQLRIAVP
jgi:hypothetical protein